MTDPPQGRQLQPPGPRVPEPRNRKVQGFVAPPDDLPETTTYVSETAAPASTREAAERPVTSSQFSRTAPKGGQLPKHAGSLRKAQIYVDETIDEYLWEIRVEAASQRLDVPSAAVARLAFHHLMAEMSPAKVVEHLATGQDREGPGRKRR
jgi:hypothetical protein